MGSGGVSSEYQTWFASCTVFLIVANFCCCYFSVSVFVKCLALKGMLLFIFQLSWMLLLLSSWLLVRSSLDSVFCLFCSVTKTKSNSCMQIIQEILILVNENPFLKQHPKETLTLQSIVCPFKSFCILIEQLHA